MASRMMPVAAALMWKPACGREIQLNIWIGIAVNGENSQSKLRKGIPAEPEAAAGRQ